MKKLNKLDSIKIGKRYSLNRSSFFPIIAAVLNGTQNGLVFADISSNEHLSDSSCILVLHHFGFAQVLGGLNPDFIEEVFRYIAGKYAHCKTIRFYGAQQESLFQAVSGQFEKVERQRLTLSNDKPLQDMPSFSKGLSAESISNDLLIKVEKKFGITTNFWNDSDDFVSHSEAVVLTFDGEPAALCYAAAVAFDKAEIDIVTCPEKRKQGLAKIAGCIFVKQCLQSGIEPLWDCYTNNEGSMKLAKSLGFVSTGNPYPFFIKRF